MTKGKKGKSNAKTKGKKKENQEFMDLVNSVSDIDIEGFECEVPSIEKLDDLNIPVDVVVPDIEELGSLLEDYQRCPRDLSSAWFELKNYPSFSFLTKKDKHQARRELIDTMKKQQKIKRFKKWKFALQNREKAKAKGEGEGKDNQESMDWGIYFTDTGIVGFECKSSSAEAKGKTKGKGEVKGKENQEVMELVNSVTDEEIVGFECEVPPVDTLDDLCIPIPDIDLPDIQKLDNILGQPDCPDDLKNAWDELNYHSIFAFLMDEEKHHVRRGLANILKTHKRIMYFKKWMFALEKRKEKKGEDDLEGVDISRSVELEGTSGAEDSDLREIEVSRETSNKVTIESESKKEDDPSLATPNNIGFPVYLDEDHIRYYEKPFLLVTWMKDHKNPTTRWLSEYKDWSRKNKSLFVGMNEDDWKGCRLRRECLLLMQALGIAMMKYHVSHGPHGHITENSFLITQLPPIDCGGVRKVFFEAKITPPALQKMNTSSTYAELLAQDMNQVIYILQKFIEGGEPDHDLVYFFELLNKYPFPKQHYWYVDLLKNHPGLWDGHERSSFIMQFYSALKGDKNKNGLLRDALVNANFERRCIIPANTLYYDIFTYSGEPKHSDETRVRKINYNFYNIDDPLRYSRAVLFHLLENGRSVDIREAEMCISQLFVGMTSSIYTEMCIRRIFL